MNRRRAGLLLSTTMAVLAVLTSSCGLLNGSNGSTGSTGGPSASGGAPTVEKPAVTIGILAGPDDAPVELEPYITEAEHDVGATEPFPLITQATNGMPLSGYVAGDRFISADPRTVAAFQRSVVAANRLIATPGELAKVLPALTGVDPSLVP